MNRTTPPAAPVFEDLPPRRSPATGVRKRTRQAAELTPLLTHHLRQSASIRVFDQVLLSRGYRQAVVR